MPFHNILLNFDVFRSALAEAELEYRENHESTAIFLPLELELNFNDFAARIGHSIPEDSAVSLNCKVQPVIWTTTPWTLPANKAIAYNQGEKYSLVFKTNTHPEDRIFYIVASALVKSFQDSVGANIRVLTEFSGDCFQDLEYKHPWFEGQKCPFLHGDFVSMDKGTGLVHAAPAHGQDDFLLALKNSLQIVSHFR